MVSFAQRYPNSSIALLCVAPSIQIQVLVLFLAFCFNNTLFYRNNRFIILILNMKMRWIVLVVKHFNDNSIKSTNLWHINQV